MSNTTPGIFDIANAAQQRTILLYLSEPGLGCNGHLDRLESPRW
jgi:hypothetical protein